MLKSCLKNIHILNSRTIIVSDEEWFIIGMEWYILEWNGIFWNGMIYNRQYDCVNAESREAANQDFGQIPVHKFQFKVIVWAGIIFENRRRFG